jgi:hypothetical protein
MRSRILGSRSPSLAVRRIVSATDRTCPELIGCGSVERAPFIAIVIASMMSGVKDAFEKSFMRSNPVEFPRPLGEISLHGFRYQRKQARRQLARFDESHAKLTRSRGTARTASRSCVGACPCRRTGSTSPGHAQASTLRLDQSRQGDHRGSQNREYRKGCKILDHFAAADAGRPIPLRLGITQSTTGVGNCFANTTLFLSPSWQRRGRRSCLSGNLPTGAMQRSGQRSEAIASRFPI